MLNLNPLMEIFNDPDPEPDSNWSIMDPRSANYDPDAVAKYRAWKQRHPDKHKERRYGDPRY